jgi:NADH:ubiquinone oxidoreductase subunit 4 (subunit M)
MLWMVQRLFYGQESKMVATETPDLRFGEQLVLWPLAVLMLVMGVSPNYWLRTIEMAPKPLVSQQLRMLEILGQPDIVPGQNGGEVQR